MTQRFARTLFAATWLVACSSAPGLDTTLDGDGVGGADTPSPGAGSPTTTGSAATATAGTGGAAGSGNANGGTAGTSASEGGAGTSPSTAGSGASGEDAGGAEAGGAPPTSTGGTGSGGAESGGAANVGGNPAVDPNVDSCAEFTCVDLGSCSVQPEPEGCARVCTVSPTYTFAEASQVERLAELRCDIIDGTLIFPQTSPSGVPTGDERRITQVELETVRRITGAIRVESASLTTLHLPNLQWIAGMGIGAGPTRIAIYDARQLESIRLPRLQGTRGDINIAANPSLVSVDMSSLEEVGEGGTSSLLISSNDELRTLNGLPALAGASLLVTANPKLPQCAIDELASRVGVSCVDCRDNDYASTCE